MDAQLINKMEILPIFSSSLGSINKSILTINYNGEINDDMPVGIFDIAKKNNLDHIYLLEDQMCSFIQAYENSLKSGVKLKYGCKIILSHNDENTSLGVYNVFALNTEGYYELIKIKSIWAHKNENNKHHLHTTFEEVKDLFASDNLLIMIPFYDSFLFNNLTEFSQATPDLSKINPIFCIEKHETIYDHLIEPFVIDYCKNNNYDVINTHSVFYYKEEDFKPYLVYRAVEKRGNWFKPELKHFSSNKFSFESIQKFL